MDLRKLSLYFAAGSVGGIFAAALLWFFGQVGIMDHFDVSLKPAFTQEWGYLRLVHGGFWGFLFFLPVVDRLPVVKGLILSLIPTCFTLFVLYPIFLKKGMMGSHYGDLTWAATAVIQGAWGAATGLWLKWTS